MHILIVNNTVIPVKKYGGTERVIWSLGKELVQLGHKVSYLVKARSSSSFADIYPLSLDLANNSLNQQIKAIHKHSGKEPIDFVHCHFPVKERIDLPHLFTIHGNGQTGETFPLNTVFISKNHAERHSSKHFVYNGMDWDSLPDPRSVGAFDKSREGLAFLSDTKRPEKNLLGAIELARSVNKKLSIMGGWKLNFSSQLKYFGQVDDVRKAEVFSRSEAMLFPVLWDEPFGLAPIEAMFYGCPVWGTPYGALPELITPVSSTLKKNSYGVVSEDKFTLIKALKMLRPGSYKAEEVSDYVRVTFSYRRMAKGYLDYYERVLKGEKLHTTKPPTALRSSDRNHLYPW